MAFNDLLIRTLEGQNSGRPPIWLMRQAGRYMAEYREIRSRVSFLELCKTPELACEVTLQPIEAFGLDSAILFSDILVPIEPMGVNLDFKPAPYIADPVRTLADAERMKVVNPAEDLKFIMDAIKLMVSKLNVPLIGFSGAPFTLACYMIEGEGSKNFLEVKKMMHNEEKAFRMLMEKLAESTAAYLQEQVKNGCPVVQMFDTWAGIVSPYEYEEFIYPYVKQVVDSVEGAHFIYFAKDSSSFYPVIKQLNCSALGVDWKITLEQADKALDSKFTLQGNMDPALLFADKATITKYAEKILAEGKNIKGHVFNLGHGIMPKTPVENVKHLVDLVKSSD
ncbi:uroporphyrinogen decarboxylase [Limisalsivibrio acetivorans]|uniref:uroporphyrinogen decarboxylase n=1 Tax=Limisalsivibrio acetivorans TaxID=1304888 RepID=UPI0003B4F559|nr:uroporphyrinogen decarboxylase [Limisalsivibrio acetivorans]